MPVAFFSQHDAPLERDYCHTVHFVLTHFQCQISSSSSQGSGGSRCQPESISLYIHPASSVGGCEALPS